MKTVSRFNKLTVPRYYKHAHFLKMKTHAVDGNFNVPLIFTQTNIVTSRFLQHIKQTSREPAYSQA